MPFLYILFVQAPVLLWFLTTFAFQGAPGTPISTWQPGPQVWSVSQLCWLITWPLFASFMLIPCKDSSRKSQSSWTVLEFECVMSFGAMSLCVVGPTRTSWPPWPTWVSGCYRNPRTTGKRKGQLDGGEWAVGVSLKFNSAAAPLAWIELWLPVM